MMKIIASLVILGLCANVCYGTAVALTSSSQSTAFTGLNSSASTKVYSASNSTDAAVWDSTKVGDAATSGIPAANVIFGPGASNDTSYVYGYTTASASAGTASTGQGVQTTTSITKIVKRTVNNTIVGWANDTVEASVVASDTSITASILADTSAYAVAPGYLGIVSTGYDGSYYQVYYTLVSGSSASPVKITSTTDVTTNTPVSATAGCTKTTFTVGNIWYDQGSEAFFYTYNKKFVTTTVGGSSGTCGGSTASTVNTIYVGGVFLNGTAVMTAPLALATAAPANTPTNIVGGGDNWLNASNIYVAYLDAAYTGTNTATGNVYYQKITKSSTATAGTFTSLVANTVTGTITVGSPNSATTPVVTTSYVPLSVWSSNYTYGIAVSNITQTQTAAQYPATTGSMTYAVTNYLNSTLTATDSGISYSSATGVGKVYGWQLNTGYTLVASWSTSTSGTSAYTWGTFYGNGTVNATAATLGSVQGPVSFYEDVNGTNWIGWTDVETANTPSMTYAGYLAKFQGQLNVPGSSASVLSAISAFFALFLAAVFVF